MVWLLWSATPGFEERNTFRRTFSIGGIMGSLVAQQIYTRHHDPELGGSDWPSIGELFREGRASPENRGSPYVPLDSWIYPALDRLAAFGLVDSAICRRPALDAPGMCAAGQRSRGTRSRRG